MPLDDFTSTRFTTGKVVVGGFATGEIETAGDESRFVFASINVYRCRRSIPSFARKSSSGVIDGMLRLHR